MPDVLPTIQPVARNWVVGGLLDDGWVTDRENLYVTRDGQAVQRFSVLRDDVAGTFIFKPLESALTLQRERWLQQHLFSRLPVHVPILLAWSGDEEPPWGIFNDLGRLDHHLTEEDVAVAAGAAWTWHRIDSLSIPPFFAGQKPQLSEAAGAVSTKWTVIDAALSNSGFSENARRRWMHLGMSDVSSLSQEPVLVHGDYHFENVSRTEGGLAVLDWEFVHMNSPYWDLYTLLDMPHPRYRKDLSLATRIHALEGYASARASNGKPVPGDFYHDYFRFASVYSLWMLWLIQEDRAYNRWDPVALDACELEVTHTLQICDQAFS